MYEDYKKLQVSIHTPTQGVTLFHTPTHNLQLVSIHTPTQGVTFIDKLIAVEGDVSIHTPTQGVTPRKASFR